MQIQVRERDTKIIGSLQYTFVVVNLVWHWKTKVRQMEKPLWKEHPVVMFPCFLFPSLSQAVSRRGFRTRTQMSLPRGASF
jgi:hypothetical protein